MSAAISKLRTSFQEGRAVNQKNAFHQLAYLALTGGGKDDWMRFDRNVRIVRMLVSVVLFIVALVIREAIGRKVFNR